MIEVIASSNVFISLGSINGLFLFSALIIDFMKSQCLLMIMIMKEEVFQEIPIVTT